MARSSSLSGEDRWNTVGAAGLGGGGGLGWRVRGGAGFMTRGDGWFYIYTASFRRKMITRNKDLCTTGFDRLRQRQRAAIGYDGLCVILRIVVGVYMRRPMHWLGGERCSRLDGGSWADAWSDELHH